MVFQIFALITDNHLLEFPYCALSSDRNRLLMICDEMIRYDSPTEQADSETLYRDYIPTSRYFDLDLSELEKLIHAYTQQDRFSFCADYSEELKGIMLTFPNPREGFQNWSERLTDKDTNNLSRMIQYEVDTNLKAIIDQVFEIA